MRSIYVLMLIVVLAWPMGAGASTTDELLVKLQGESELERAEARQMLVWQGVEALPRIVPLVAHSDERVWRAAFNVVADIANETTVPGREADRVAATDAIMTLIGPEQPERVKRQGLRLLAPIVPAGYDIGPVAAMLDEPKLRERARRALREMGTPEARAALRAQLAKAEPAFQCALLDALAGLRDAESVDVARKMLTAEDPGVRAAAARAVAWTGDPMMIGRVRGVVDRADDATRAEAWDALLQLLNTVEAKGGNVEIVGTVYLDLVRDREGVVRDAGLAGLGRVGDESCVGVVLEAMKGADRPTQLVAMSALRAMLGRGVTKALVGAYPKQDAAIQAVLVHALVARGDEAARALVAAAAKAPDATLRDAAKKALADQEAIEAAAQRAEELARIYRSGGGGGVLRSWWVCGPFPLGEAREGWTKDFVGEATIDPPALSGDAAKRWKHVRTDDANGAVNFGGIVAMGDYRVAYAFAAIEVADACDAELRLGSDDAVRAWVNGKLVHDHWVDRGAAPDQDVVPIKLAKGRNRILLKIGQNRGGWGYCARLTRPNGDLLSFKEVGS
jgi:HEAT repeat protein